jgi:hypothetical protein
VQRNSRNHSPHQPQPPTKHSIVATHEWHSSLSQENHTTLHNVTNHSPLSPHPTLHTHHKPQNTRCVSSRKSQPNQYFAATVWVTSVFVRNVTSQEFFCLKTTHIFALPKKEKNTSSHNKHSSKHSHELSLASAICVQRFDDSLTFAIRTTYRISLRSSSSREPRYPLLRVVDILVFLFFSVDLLL